MSTVIYDSTATPHDERLPSSVGVVFGVIAPKPIRSSLRGRFRVRLRVDEFTAVWVRNEDGIRKFHVADFGDHWQLCYEHAGNVRYEPR